MEYVYLATDGDRLKIGRTWNCMVRMGQLKRSAKKTITLIGIIKTTGIRESHQLEMKIHKLARDIFPTRGEWYPLNKNIKELMTNREGFIYVDRKFSY